jgi:hypothetical protein
VQQDYNQASAYISALCGIDAAQAVVDFRFIHDKNKGDPGRSLRATLPQAWADICSYNSAGYGVFVAINELDGQGRELHNVKALRAHVIDCDDVNTSAQSYALATQWNPLAAFAVSSSPGKVHIYWPVQPYADQLRYSTLQRKLIAMFNSDKSITDAARVMRMPGTFHMKGDTPQFVTCHALPGYGQRVTVDTLEAALAGVNVVDGGGSRAELGDPSHAAPSLEWALAALSSIDPNSLDRAEWITVMAGFKQSVWTLCSEEQAFDYFSQWCARYAANDPAENLKQWKSIRNTEVGWGNLSRRSPQIQAQLKLGAPAPRNVQPAPSGGVPPMPTPPPAGGMDDEILTAEQCAEYFKGCFFVERFGTILAPSKRHLNQTQFNGRYGGKIFVIDSMGKTTKSAWEAALSSTLWRIPKVDHIRFLPHRAPFDLISDELGRKGVNTYTPAIIERRQGDVTPFLRHMELIMPDAGDRKIYLDYLAHNARFPGHKIPWAPLIQSEEGAGKGVIKTILTHVMGSTYVHAPNAKELVESGSKFNAWMRGKLFIIVDEIKVDERRDMIEVLKPMISEKEIEIQGKGVDQDKEDNYSNWAFFSNYKDAIPIRQNGRRFAVFYSSIQSANDLLVRGMDGAYFNNLYSWLDYGGGKEIVADWLLNYPIERGAIPMRAPDTTSTAEALEQSRGTLEQLLVDLVSDAKPGFIGGWASSLAFANAARTHGINIKSTHTIARVFEAAGYRKIGRAHREYFQEGPGHRTTLYSLFEKADPTLYGLMQGYGA